MTLIRPTANGGFTRPLRLCPLEIRNKAAPTGKLDERLAKLSYPERMNQRIAIEALNSSLYSTIALRNSYSNSRPVNATSQIVTAPQQKRNETESFDYRQGTTAPSPLLTSSPVLSSSPLSSSFNSTQQPNQGRVKTVSVFNDGKYASPPSATRPPQPDMNFMKGSSLFHPRSERPFVNLPTYYSPPSIRG